MTIREDLQYALIWADVFDAERFRYLLNKQRWSESETKEAQGRLVKYHLDVIEKPPLL